MEHEKRSISNFDLWKTAARYHLKYQGELLPIFPLLLIPIWTDCYHSILIQQAIENDGVIHPGVAIGKTLKLLPSFISNKLGLFVIAYLWALIPIIGWYKGYRFRIKWAMVSNVMVFEKPTDQSTHKRCNELADLVVMEKRSNALWAIPSVLFFIILLVFMLGTTAIASSVFFWVSCVLSIYLLLPCSAVVNTLVYLSVTDNLAVERIQNNSSAA